MDRFEAMAMLVAVVEKGSLSAASKALNVPLTTVSRRISDLETHLGKRLLDRTTRKQSLTDAGLAYVSAARRIVGQVEEAEQLVRGDSTEPKGELRIRVSASFCDSILWPIVADFMQACPQIKLTLQAADCRVGGPDIVADVTVQIGAASNVSNVSRIATQVGEVRTITCASPALLAVHGVPKRPNDLSHMPCIAVGAPETSVEWGFSTQRQHKTMSVPVWPQLIVPTTQSAMMAATADLGVAQLPHYEIADALSRDALRPLLDKYEAAPMPINLLHGPLTQLPVSTRCFLAFCAPRLRMRLGAICTT